MSRKSLAQIRFKCFTKNILFTERKSVCISHIEGVVRQLRLLIPAHDSNLCQLIPELEKNDNFRVSNDHVSTNYVGTVGTNMVA